MFKRAASGKKSTPDAARQSMLRLIRRVSRLSSFLAARIAFSIFFTPQPTPVLKREQSVMNEADVRHDLCCNKNRLAVYTWGSGPVILLVHGWGSRASRLCHLAPLLTAKGFCVVAFDMTAHGLSQGTQTSILDMQLMLLELQKRHGPLAGIVAHSFGALAVAYGLAHGLQAQRAVLISMPSRFGALVDRFGQVLQLGPSVIRSLQQQLQRRFSTGGKTFAEVARHFSPVNYAAAISAATLILHDEDDREIPVAESHELAAAWPQARFIGSRGLGHQRILQDGASVQAIVDFLTVPELAPAQHPDDTHGA